MSEQTHSLVLKGLLTWLCLLAAGCGPATSPQTDADCPSDSWDLVLLQGKPIGFSHTEMKPETRDGKKIAHWKQVTELNVARFGDSMRQKISVSSDEIIHGGFVAGTWQVQGANAGQSGTLRVTADGTSLLIQPDGDAKTIRCPWQSDSGGFFAVEQSLRSKPMRSGETRTVRGLLPLINQFAKFTLVAGERETVDLQGHSRQLLRIENEIALADATKMNVTLWTNDHGVVLKQTFEEMDQTIVRTNELNARVAISEAYDLGRLATVRLQHSLSSLPDLHTTRDSATYLVRRKESTTSNNAPPTFPSDRLQSATAEGPATRITIHPHRTDTGENTLPPERTVRKAALASSQLISADDEIIRKLADQATRGLEQTTDAAVVRRLETFVNEHITEKDYSQLLLGARQVADGQRGDCTEHAVLLAALCRAKGIPTRVAVGLVYVPAIESFVFHMWNESLIDEQWIPFDATLGQGGIGAGHLKVRNSNLADATAISDFLPVAQLVGQIEIELVKVGQ